MRIRTAAGGFLAAAVVAVVAACASVGDSPPATTTQFVCPGGAIMVATFRAQDSLRLEVDGRVYELPRLISASGARYGSGAVTFWNKGDGARLQRPDGPSYIGCRARE